MRYYSSAILLILALSSCASKAAIEPEGVVDNIPDNWDIETPIAINISEIWWDEFQDEKLNQFLSQFLAENINLEQAMLNTVNASSYIRAVVRGHATCTCNQYRRS